MPTTSTTTDVIDAHGAIKNLNDRPAPGRVAAVNSPPVALSNEDLAAINALGATLSSILTKLGTARTETLWTDDTGAYFIRVDNAGTITWTDTSGNSSSAPGTGSRPAAGAPILLDKSTYQATAGGTGYSIGDLLDHIVTTDPATGAIIGHFWLNTTTEAKLASPPSSANITPLSPLPAGAATAANQATANASLATIATASTSNVSSLVNIDQTTPGTTNRVALPELTAAANVAKTYTGSFTVAATALTRPANVTAYTALDSISNNATAASVTANSVSLSDTNDHPIDLAEILLDTTDTGPGTAAAKITLHLFNSDPTASTGVVGGDNAAWSNKKAGWVGSFSGTMTPFSDGSRAVLTPDAGTLRMMAPTSGAKTVFWQLQTQTAFTPSANSTTFTPTFKGFQARPA